MPNTTRIALHIGLLWCIAIVIAMLTACELSQSASNGGGLRGNAFQPTYASAGDDDDEQRDATIICHRTREGEIKFHALRGVFRKGGRRGDILYHYDGNFIRKGGRKGEKLLHVSGNVVRKGGPRGEILYVFEGPRVRKGGRNGEVLFYKDGRNLLKGGRNGDKHLYFQDGDMKDWMIIAAIYDGG